MPALRQIRRRGRDEGAATNVPELMTENRDCRPLPEKSQFKWKCQQIRSPAFNSAFLPGSAVGQYDL